MSEPYVHQRPFQVLQFEDYPGLIVRCRSGNLGQYLGIHEVAGDTPADLNPNLPEGWGSVRRLTEAFAHVLVSWNYCEKVGDADPEPVPATAEGMLAMDYQMLLAIVNGWLGAVGGVPGPLDSGSGSGDTQPEVYIPMELLS